MFLWILGCTIFFSEVWVEQKVVVFDVILDVIYIDLCDFM
jgi:hypothetical protein